MHSQAVRSTHSYAGSTRVRLRRIVVIGLTRSTKQWQTFYIKKNIKRLICDLKTYVPICQHFKTTEKPQFKYEKIKVIFKHYIYHFCKIYKHSVVLSYLYEVRFIYITDTGMWISRRQYCMNCIYTLYITVFSLVPSKRISCHPPTHLPINPPTHQPTHQPSTHPSVPAWPLAIAGSISGMCLINQIKHGTCMAHKTSQESQAA